MSEVCQVQQLCPVSEGAAYQNQHLPLHQQEFPAWDIFVFVKAGDYSTITQNATQFLKSVHMHSMYIYTYVFTHISTHDHNVTLYKYIISTE